MGVQQYFPPRSHSDFVVVISHTPNRVSPPSLLMSSTIIRKAFWAHPSNEFSVGLAENEHR